MLHLPDTAACRVDDAAAAAALPDPSTEPSWLGIASRGAVPAYKHTGHMCRTFQLHEHAGRFDWSMHARKELNRQLWLAVTSTECLVATQLTLQASDTNSQTKSTDDCLLPTDRLTDLQ